MGHFTCIEQIGYNCFQHNCKWRTWGCQLVGNLLSHPITKDLSPGYATVFHCVKALFPHVWAFFPHVSALFSRVERWILTFIQLSKSGSLVFQKYIFYINYTIFFKELLYTDKCMHMRIKCALSHYFVKHVFYYLFNIKYISLNKLQDTNSLILITFNNTE